MRWLSGLTSQEVRTQDRNTGCPLTFSQAKPCRASSQFLLFLGVVTQETLNGCAVCLFTLMPPGWRHQLDAEKPKELTVVPAPMGEWAHLPAMSHLSFPRWSRDAVLMETQLRGWVVRKRNKCWSRFKPLSLGWFVTWPQSLEHRPSFSYTPVVVFYQILIQCIKKGLFRYISWV